MERTPKNEKTQEIEDGLKTLSEIKTALEQHTTTSLMEARGKIRSMLRSESIRHFLSTEYSSKLQEADEIISNLPEVQVIDKLAGLIEDTEIGLRNANHQ